MKRLLGLELERALYFRPEYKARSQQTKPLGLPTHAVIQSLWQNLTERGWKPSRDLVTHITTRVWKEYSTDHGVFPFWSCYTDFLTGTLETTLAPSLKIQELKIQQNTLDGELLDVLRKFELFILHFGTFPLHNLSKEEFYRHYVYWIGGNQLLFDRGMNVENFGTLLASQPSISLAIDEAIVFFRIIQRIAGISIILSRFESISNQHVTAQNLLSLRVRVMTNLWNRSPYLLDRNRAGMLPEEICGWHDYFAYLMRFPLLGVGDGWMRKRLRVSGDPTFFDYWKNTPPIGWNATFPDGRLVRIKKARFSDLAGLQNQIQISRLRWTFKDDVTLNAFGDAFEADNSTLVQWLNDNIKSLYIEIRNDSCSIPGQEFSLLAFYLGLLYNLDESYRFIVGNRNYRFWKNLYQIADKCAVDIKIDEEWLPDIIGKLISISSTGLAKRKYEEERYLDPLIDRLHRFSSPAQEAKNLFTKFKRTSDSLNAIIYTYGIF